MLSETAIDALTIAYSDCYSLYPDDDTSLGAHPNTIRSLVKKGLIEPEDEDDFECEYFITKNGRKALGFTAAALAKPKRLKTAVKRAVVHFIGDTGKLTESIFPPKDLNAVVWVNDEQQADYTDALMLVDIHEAELGQIDDHIVSAIGCMVRELGFDVFIESSRRFLEFWPDE